MPGDGLTLSEGVTLPQGLRLSEGLTLPEGFQPSKWHVGRWDSGGLGRSNTEASRLVIVISVALLLEAPPGNQKLLSQIPPDTSPYETLQGISAFHIAFVVLRRLVWCYVATQVRGRRGTNIRPTTERDYDLIQLLSLGCVPRLVFGERRAFPTISGLNTTPNSRARIVRTPMRRSTQL